MGDSEIILTRPLLFTVSFMLFFSIVIALFKDIPDVKGDSQVILQPKHLPELSLQMLCNEGKEED